MACWWYSTSSLPGIEVSTIVRGEDDQGVPGTSALSHLEEKVKVKVKTKEIVKMISVSLGPYPLSPRV